MTVKNKKTIALIVIALIIIVGAIPYLLYQNFKLKDEIAQKNDEIDVLTEEDVLKSTPSATWTASKTATKTATATTSVAKESSTPASSKSDEELIAQALYEKFSTNSSTMSYTISKIEENAATGGMTFIQGEGGGGYFVAAKENGQWKIIADGNGVIECDVLDQYDIPASIVGNCFDTTTGESRQR